MSPFRMEGTADRTHHTVETAMRAAAEHYATGGLGIPEVSGKLLRPMVAWALLPPERRADPGASFWAGALAIQMVHEASLLHDDVLDDAAHRRGAPTLQARSGIGAALVAGDRYLTSAYVVALDTRSREFVEAFARSVERTVEGEMRQGASCGVSLDEPTYESIIRAKSGELFGAAAVLASVTGGEPVPTELGLRIGSLYQRVDDLLDYCTAAACDKPALQDWRQRKWTFPLGVAVVSGWDHSEEEVLDALRSGPDPALLRAVRELETRASEILRDAGRAVGDTDALAAILEAWCAAARRGVERELECAESSSGGGSTEPPTLEQAS